MLKLSLRFARHGTYLFARLARLGVLLLFVGGAGTLLVSRYWLLPNIERYHDQITDALSNAIGRPATIGRIAADWHGLRPHLLLVDVRFQDRQGATALVLEKVETEVAWTSLFAREFRLYSLILDQPDLSIKRDAQGKVFVAGLPLSGAPSDGGSADWLLNQSRIEVHDARITWLDERRGAQPLVFNQVNLLIDNGWRSHRFALRALPPKELSAQVDVRGEFRGASFKDMTEWDGQLFTQLDYADVAAWRKWVPLPVPLSSGKGALRGWMDVEHGRISQVTADLALSRVHTRLADDLPVLDLRTLHGRVGWRDVEHGIEVSTRNLSLALLNGYALPPTDFYLRYAGGEGSEPTSGEVRANKLDLQGLSTLSEYLPFDRSFKRKLSAFAPHGKVSDLYANWQGDADKLLHFKLRGRFDGMSMRQVGGIPGFSGVTGRVDGSDEGGSLSLNSRRLTLEAPGVMQEKLLFDTLSAQIGWRSGKQGLEMQFDKVAVANADMNGVLNGSYHTAAGSPGVVDITGHLTRASVRHVDRYIPIEALGKDTHAWLNSGLVGGRSDDVSLRLSGDLGKFPFPENKDGVFQIRARIADATVEFLKDWPRIEDINGNLLIEGRRLEVTALSASTAGNALHNVSAVIPDLLSPDLLLRVYGESAGETARALGYVRTSPVHGFIGGFTDDATALGNGELKLKLDIPLLGNKPVKVDGSYHFMGDDIDLGGGIPLLQEASGELFFSESSVSTRNFTMKTLGGPAVLEVTSGDEGKVIRAVASGTARMDALRDLSPQPLLRYLHGSTPWDLHVTVQNKQALTVFNSNLAGLVSDLPAPFAKRAGEKIPLRFEQKLMDGEEGEISLQYGTLIHAQLSSYKADGGWKVRGGTVAFGKEKKWPERQGLWLVGEIPQLSVEGWVPLFSMAGGAAGPGVEGADVHIRKVTGYGQAIENLHVNAHSRDGNVFVALAAKDLNGEVAWQPQGRGVLRIRLTSLALSRGTGKEDSGAGKPVTVAEKGGRESPEIHFSTESLSYQGRQLGGLELQAKQSGGNWLLEKVKLTNADGELNGSGQWLTSGVTPQTLVHFRLQIKDVGRLLTRSGYPDSVKNGGGILEGDLAWPGNPDEFSTGALGGTLTLNVGNGRFLKIDPGAGKLLSILSLQPFHFADAFSKGYAFDNITCTAQINQGILTTGDFKIEGSPAKVTMAGVVDLKRETLNLKVVIEPEVSGAASALAFFAANPAAGVGVWLIEKIFKNPIEKITSFEYNVTGTWEKPIVAKAGSGR